MTSTVLAGWVWLCVAMFVLGCLWRAWRYSSTPVHLRWDLYPVAHEPRRDHGGSYLEEREWWTKPRRKDMMGEVFAMAAEIMLLEGVRENNRRLWWGSFPFHWGLYLLVVTTFGLAVEAVGLGFGYLVPVLTVTGAIGGVLTALGALVLLVMRSTEAKLRPYTTTADRANLVVLAAFGGLSVLVAVWAPGMRAVVGQLRTVLTFQASAIDPLWAAQMAVGSLFLLYLPATRMVHFFAKYFTYHKVRWDDQPLAENAKMATRVHAALNFGVDWSADHVRTGKTWAEVATTLPESEEGSK